MVTLKLISSLIAITAHWESYMVDKLLAVFYCSVCKHILRKFFKEGLQIIYFISLAHPVIASCSLHTSVFTGTYMEYSRITSFSFWNSAVVVVSRSVLSDSCNPTDCSLPGSSVHGVLQARILEWVAVSSSRGSSWPRDWTQVSFCLLHWQADSLPLGHKRSPCD